MMNPQSRTNRQALACEALRNRNAQNPAWCEQVARTVVIGCLIVLPGILFLVVADILFTHFQAQPPSLLFQRRAIVVSTRVAAVVLLLVSPLVSKIPMNKRARGWVVLTAFALTFLVFFGTGRSEKGEKGRQEQG